MQQFAEGCEGVIAVDGKTLRRSCDRAGQRSPLHLVGAWAGEQRLAPGQVAVDAKSSEITALPQLLAMLTLRGKVVTADAMHCQRPVAQQVTGQGGDYALALKGNQGTLRDDVQRMLDVTCEEPQARNRKGHCAENLALHLTRLESSKGSMRGKLKRAGRDDGFLIRILAQFAKIHMR